MPRVGEADATDELLLLLDILVQSHDQRIPTDLALPYT